MAKIYGKISEKKELINRICFLYVNEAVLNLSIEAVS
jgi:hypothetical protein